MKKRRWNRPRGKRRVVWVVSENKQIKQQIKQKIKMEKLKQLLEWIGESWKRAIIAIMLIIIFAAVGISLNSCGIMKTSGNVNWEIEAMKKKMEADSLKAMLDEKSQKNILVYGRQSGAFPTYALMESRA